MGDQILIKHVLLAVAQIRSLPCAHLSHESHDQALDESHYDLHDESRNQSCDEFRSSGSMLETFGQEEKIEKKKAKEKGNVQLKRSLSRLLITALPTLTFGMSAALFPFWMDG